MSKRLQVDTDALAVDGRELAALSDSLKHEQVSAPATDPVSTSMSFAMSALDEGFVQRLGEAKQVREHGGALVTASAVMFDAADEQGALLVDRVEVLGNGGRRPGEVPTINVPRQPDTRGTPRVPRVEAQSMDAEDFADAIHTGRGAERLRDLSVDRETGADTLQYLGDKTRRIADSIQEHWADADNNAAPAVRTHGTWLNGASEWADKFGKSADSIAQAFDTVMRATPTPTQLSGAKRFMEWSAVLSPVAFLAARARYEGLKAKAIEAGAVYQSSVQNAVSGVDKPISTPPLIGKQAVIPAELVKGPGTWATAVRNEGDWRNYEHQVTGTPAGMEYEVPRSSGAPVDFDGFDPDAGPNGLLLEAKSNGYHWMVGPDGEFKDLPPAVKLQDQITRQFEAAREAGIPVQWRVAESNVAEAIQQYIEDNNYEGWVSVVHVPAA